MVLHIDSCANVAETERTYHQQTALCYTVFSVHIGDNQNTVKISG